MTAYTPKETLRLAKRFNNAKRSYLLVNPLQAKHIPVSPTEALKMMDALGGLLAEQYPETRLVVGFAETATAIGAAAAARMGEGCVYLPTTREAVPEAGEWVLFSEEHSHAVEQKLCADRLLDFIKDTPSIIFVDDEISTGRTLRNMICQLRERYPGLRDKKMIAASLLNRVSPEDQRLLSEAGVRCEWLVKLPELDGLEEIAALSVREAPPVEAGDLEFSRRELSCGPLPDPRRGVLIQSYRRSCMEMAQAFAEEVVPSLAPGSSVAVLGTEECMYPALVLGKLLEDMGFSVRSHATTRSPIGICGAPGYPILSGQKLRSFYGDGRDTYLYNFARYDAVVVVSDASVCDKEALQELAAAWEPYGYQKLFFVQGAEMFGTYRSDDVTILLKDITGLVEPLGTREREERIQSGVHYSEMLPIEYEPSPAYLAAYQDALGRYAGMTAEAVASVGEQIWRDKGKRAVLVSLARAGTPIGILIKRFLQLKYGASVEHYTISIIRGRGIDRAAMNYILARHPAESLQFVDGWTGKGAIQNELNRAMEDYPGVDPGLAVLSDPGCLAGKRGTYDDFLIASSCLNSTVSGLLSRTFFREDIIGPGEFHGAAFYRELMDRDLTYQFIDTVASRFTLDGHCAAGGAELSKSAGEEVEGIQARFQIADRNLVKPGIGEATRVLLRRVPWKILVHSLHDEEHLGHIYQLAKEKNVRLEEYPLEHYRACGLIQALADN